MLCLSTVPYMVGSFAHKSKLSIPCPPSHMIEKLCIIRLCMKMLYFLYACSTCAMPHTYYPSCGILINGFDTQKHCWFIDRYGVDVKVRSLQQIFQITCNIPLAGEKSDIILPGLWDNLIFLRMVKVNFI